MFLALSPAKCNYKTPGQNSKHKCKMTLEVGMKRAKVLRALPPGDEFPTLFFWLPYILGWVLETPLT